MRCKKKKKVSKIRTDENTPEMKKQLLSLKSVLWKRPCCWGKYDMLTSPLRHILKKFLSSEDEEQCCHVGQHLYRGTKSPEGQSQKMGVQDRNNSSMFQSNKRWPFLVHQSPLPFPKKWRHKILTVPIHIAGWGWFLTQLESMWTIWNLKTNTKPNIK